MAGGIDYIAQSAQVQTAIDQYIRGLQVPPGPPTQHGIYATPEWTGNGYPSIDWQAIAQNQEPPEGWPRPPKFNEPGDVPGPPVQFGEAITNANVKAGFNFIPNGVEEKNLYYYHPDHLGSSSYITDREGQIIQHTEYIAFGETFVDEHSTSNKQPYLFNGKELDYETGLYYYGARYYDPKVSIFLNVDPLVEKTGTPYAYTYNNPIRFIDPTGMIAIPPEDSGGYKTGEVWKDNDGSWTRINGGWKNHDKNGESYIDEVVVTGKKNESNVTTYLGYTNDIVGETGDWLTTNNKGGSIGIWTTPIKNRTFDGITYSRLNIRYYGTGWKGNQYVKTRGIGELLKRGSIVGSAVLGAIEIGEGVSTDYNDYQTKGETNGKNTVKATAKVVVGTTAGWAAGAATGAAVGTFIPIPIVGTAVGFVVGAGIGYITSEFAGELVEKAYE